MAAADDFNRPNSSSLGSTPVGALVWESGGIGDWAISSGALVVANVNPATYGTWCVVDTGEPDGTVSLRILDASVGAGIALRSEAPNSRNTLSFAAAGANYKLYADLDTVTIATSSGVTPADGDVLTVVLAGAGITCKVNGATVITATHSVGQTRTHHGAVITQIGTAAAFDDFSWEPTNATVKPAAATAWGTANGGTVSAGDGEPGATSIAIAETAGATAAAVPPRPPSVAVRPTVAAATGRSGGGEFMALSRRRRLHAGAPVIRRGRQN